MFYSLRLNENIIQPDYIVSQKDCIRYVFNILYSKYFGDITHRRNPDRIIYIICRYIQDKITHRVGNSTKITVNNTDTGVYNRLFGRLSYYSTRINYREIY